MAWGFGLGNFQLQGPGSSGAGSSGGSWFIPNYGPNYMNGAGGWMPSVGDLNFGNYANQLQNPVAGISAAGTQMPGTGAVNPAAFQFGLNVPTINMGINALGTLGNLYLGHEAMQMGWDNFRLQRDYAAKNYANAVQAYNTAMEDRIRARAAQYGESEEWIQEQLARNLLPEPKKK